MYGPLIIVLESIYNYSELDQGLEKGGLLKNILSLVNWMIVWLNLMKHALQVSISYQGMEFNLWDALLMKVRLRS